MNWEKTDVMKVGKEWVIAVWKLVHGKKLESVKVVKYLKLGDDK